MLMRPRQTTPMRPQVNLGWVVGLMESPLLAKLVDLLYDFLSKNRIQLSGAMVGLGFCCAELRPAAGAILKPARRAAARCLPRKPLSVALLRGAKHSAEGPGRWVTPGKPVVAAIFGGRG